MNRKLRLLPLLAIILAFPAPAPAALDAESKTPYQLQIVLNIGANRVFTPTFHELLERDIANRLKLAFGNLARIEVVRTHPLLADVLAKGLDATLESYDTLSERTTHFVLVDYAAGRFQIQSRFHEGLIGAAGPVSVHRVTHDRDELAATIARIVESAFSPVGTVTAVGKEVTLALKGGELGVPLDRWVKKGHVFAVSKITEQGSRKKAHRHEWALLEVLNTASGGTCRCRYWQRYQEDSLSEVPGTLGYRAMLLATATQPVRVQLFDDATLLPLDGVRVRVQQSGVGKPVELITNRDGLALTREDFANWALVQVLAGETVRAQFPVELIPGRTAVARVKIQGDGEAMGPFVVRRDAWQRRVFENSRMSTDRARELAAQLHQSLGAALDAGKKSLPVLEAEIAYLEKERDQLDRLGKEKKWKFDSRDGTREISELHKQAKDLSEFIARLEGVMKDPNFEKTAGLVKLTERARLLEGEAEFDLAIRLYEQIVQASPGEKAIRAHLDKLKKDWTVVNADHKSARDFLTQTWPSLDVASLGKNLEKAKESLAVCKAAQDKMTPVKFVRSNAAHTANLTAQLETLKRRDSEDNRNKAKTLAQTGEALSRLHLEAVDWIGAK
jgi:hypothetical protein